MEILQLSTFFLLIAIAVTCGCYAGYEVGKSELERKYLNLLNHYNDLKNFKEFNK